MTGKLKIEQNPNLFKEGWMGGIMGNFSFFLFFFSPLVFAHFLVTNQKRQNDVVIGSLGSGNR
jgi:hypothetical protein